MRIRPEMAEDVEDELELSLFELPEVLLVEGLLVVICEVTETVGSFEDEEILPESDAGFVESEEEL